MAEAAEVKLALARMEADEDTGRQTVIADARKRAQEAVQRSLRSTGQNRK